MAITTTYQLRTGIVAVVTPGATETVIGDNSDGLVYVSDTPDGSQFGIINENGIPTLIGEAGGDFPAVAILSNGNIVVATVVANALQYEIFTPGGTSITQLLAGVENVSNLQVASRPGNNGFVIAYDRNYGAGDFDIHLRFYDNAGVETDVRVPDASLSTDQDPSIAVLAGGNVAVAWTRTVGSSTEMWYAVYSGTGAVVMAATEVEIPGTIHRNVDMVATPDGGFAFVFEHDATASGDTSLYLVTAGATGLINGAAYVPSIGVGSEADASITVLDNGYLVITSANDGDVRTSVYDSTGTVNFTSIATGPADDFSVNSIHGGRIGLVYDRPTGTQLSALDTFRIITGDAANDTYTAVDVLNHDMDGGGGSDTLSGFDGDDIIHGGTEGDTVSGGWGEDSLFGDAGDDLIAGGFDSDVIHGGAGADEIYAAFQGDPDASGVADFLFGDADNDTLRGSLEGDTLDGGTGADAMTGGDGDDNYYVDNAGDTIVESAGNGIDTLFTSVTFNAGALSLDVINMTGTANITVLGSNDATIIVGNSGNNGLNGGGGVDNLQGGLGNDTYTVDNVGDLVVEAADAGIDLIKTSVGFDAGNANSVGVENITLTGSAGTGAIGNALANTIIGNAGANYIDGAAGADHLEGGLGDDIYVIDNAADLIVEADGAGTDQVYTTVTYNGGLTPGIEIFSMTGAANITVAGNALNNTIIGNSGNNGLNGNAGADYMEGGLGNDTYTVDNVGDVVFEDAAAGVDLIRTAVTFNGGVPNTVNVENFTMTGSNNITVAGNALNNIILGNSGNNGLNGNAGADHMEGGLGNDTYTVDNVSDVVVEAAGAGADLVKSSITFSAAGAGTVGIESITLTGSAAVDATGNALNNTLIGNAGGNGLNGGAGADRLEGGLGNDFYTVDNVGDVVVELAGQGTDLVRSSVSFQALGTADQVENVTLTGSAEINAVGNNLDNNLIGNSAANILNGMFGADRMEGGLGNDTYSVDNVGDVIVELVGGGADSVQSFISLTLAAEVENLWLVGSATVNATGNSLANVLEGNGAVNILTGGLGKDTLLGGGGADRFDFNAIAESTVANYDRIIDLTNADVIDLSNIDANANVGGDQAFALVAAFTNVAGQMTLAYNSGQNFTVLNGDVNGDGVSDFRIIINGLHTDFTNFSL